MTCASSSLNWSSRTSRPCRCLLAAATRNVERVQAIVTALLKQRLAASLERVEARWPAGGAASSACSRPTRRSCATWRGAERWRRRPAGVGPDRDRLAAALGPRRGPDRPRGAGGADRQAAGPDSPGRPTWTSETPPRLPRQARGGEAAARAGRDAGSRRRPPRRACRSRPRSRGDPKLVLRFGYGLTPAIADLDLGEEALSRHAQLRRPPHHCVLPWTAVYAVVVGGAISAAWCGRTTCRPRRWPTRTSSRDEVDAGPAAGKRDHLKLVD